MTEFLHRFRALSYCRTYLHVAALASLFAASEPAKAADQEVVFRVGTQSSIDWFVIDNPSIHGTLNVNNAPYATNTALNAAAVDVSRNRLIYDTQGSATHQGYAISLTGLQLIQNGATAVTLTALGAWSDGSADAGYRKTDGQIYYHAEGTDQFRQLNFDGSGLITGFTAIGKLNGSNSPNAITAGDIDFSSNGSIWITGDNDNGDPTLWNFDSSTLNAISTIDLANLYNGITFNATGDTLYGYQSATGEYGPINLTTGAFQMVIDTDATFFGTNGDLATGTADITIIPEPACLSLLFGMVLPFLSRRRRRA